MELKAALREANRRLAYGEEPSSILESLDFKLGNYGVEGWACGLRIGVEYSNTGDTYKQTLFAITDGGCVRFLVSDMAAIVSRYPQASSLRISQ